jgi:hypothetical protein
LLIGSELFVEYAPVASSQGEESSQFETVFGPFRCTQYQVTTEGEEFQAIVGVTFDVSSVPDEEQEQAIGETDPVIKEPISFDMMGLDIVNTS